MQPSKIKNILVIRLWAVAEILSATPLIRALHQLFPGAKIDFLLEEKFADLLAGCTFIENIIPWSSLGRRASFREILWTRKKIRRHGYDLVVDLQGEERTAFLSFLSRARYRIGYHLSGLRGRFYNMRTKVSPVKKHLVLSYLDLIGSFIQAAHGPLDLKLCMAGGTGPVIGQFDRPGVEIEDGGKKKFLIYPSAERPTMVWPVERFAQLAYYLMSRGMAEVILAGADTEEDRLMVERINRLLDKKGRVFFYSTLSQLISLMQTVDLFIGSDSGPMHIAAALGKPVTALFGPTDPRERHPWGSGHEVVWKRLPCSPCNLSECFKGEAGCMAQIEVSTVLQAVGRFLTDT